MTRYIDGKPVITPSKLGQNPFVGTPVEGQPYTQEQQRELQLRYDEVQRNRTRYELPGVYEMPHQSEPTSEFPLGQPMKIWTFVVASEKTRQKLLVILPSGKMRWVKWVRG